MSSIFPGLYPPKIEAFLPARGLTLCANLMIPHRRRVTPRSWTPETRSSNMFRTSRWINPTQIQVMKPNASQGLMPFSVWRFAFQSLKWQRYATIELNAWFQWTKNRLCKQPSCDGPRNHKRADQKIPSPKKTRFSIGSIHIAVPICVDLFVSFPQLFSNS